jgi:hypothetical protein
VDSDSDIPFDDPDQERRFKRPIENLAYCPPEKCKDEKGEWTKWVIERLDDAQRKQYD